MGKGREASVRRQVIENDGATCGGAGCDKTQASCTADLALEKEGIKLACEATIHCKARENKKVRSLAGCCSIANSGPNLTDKPQCLYNSNSSSLS